MHRLRERLGGIESSAFAEAGSRILLTPADGGVSMAISPGGAMSSRCGNGLGMRTQNRRDRPQAQKESQMDWTFEVVVLPVSRYQPLD